MGTGIHSFFSALFLSALFLFLNLPVIGQSASPSSPQQKKIESESLVALSPQELYRRLAPSVFVVETLDSSGSVVAKGSAVAITSGEVVTNRHVIEEGVSWRLRRGSQTWPAIITHLDPDHDLCQLKAKGLATRPVLVRSSATLAVGERVFAIGAPEGLELTMSEGLISGMREFENAQVIQTSAAISPGSSGGGLFDVHGRLVGITTFFIKEGQNLNFALPGEWVQRLMKLGVSSNHTTEAESPQFRAFILMQLGSKALDDFDPERAADDYREALRLQTDLAEAWYRLGIAYEGQPIKCLSEGKERNSREANEHAADAYKKALELKPDFAEAWWSLGECYSKLERYAEALRADQEAIKVNPQYVQAWASLGYLYHQLGDDQRASEACRQASDLKPGSSLLWTMVAVCYQALRQYPEMASSLEEAVRLEPSTGPWFLLGEAYAAQNNRKQLIEVYERLKTLQPDLADRFFRKFVLP